MIKTVFECKTITPMFCYGADGETPELRAPSLKGALRFWWRAIHPNLELADLKKKETLIFGGTGDEEAKKSSFLIQLRHSDLPTEMVNPLPHKTKSYQKSAILSKLEFTIILRTETTSKNILHLLELTAILGGIGGRSRRGFGSFRINSINESPYKFEFSNKNILKLIQKINPEFEFGEYDHNYPYLQKIELGNCNSSFDKLLYNISQASHLYNSDYTGKAMGGKYASPVYVSIHKQDNKYYPLFSTLKRTIN